MLDGSLGGPWSSSNAASLIRYTVSKGYDMSGWELGEISPLFLKLYFVEPLAVLKTRVLASSKNNFYRAISGFLGFEKKIIIQFSIDIS